MKNSLTQNLFEARKSYTALSRMVVTMALATVFLLLPIGASATWHRYSSLLIVSGCRVGRIPFHFIHAERLLGAPDATWVRWANTSTACISADLALPAADTDSVSTRVATRRMMLLSKRSRSIRRHQDPRGRLDRDPFLRDAANAARVSRSTTTYGRAWRSRFCAGAALDTARRALLVHVPETQAVLLGDLNPD